MHFRPLTHTVVIAAFVTTLFVPIPSGAQILLPEPGTMVELTPAFEPVLIKGLKVHPDNPFLFDFIVDSGQSGLLTDDPGFKTASDTLIKYFLTAMTLPEKDLWVNLSPYEKDRMVSADLGRTQMGQDMLGQDYVLKQLTASMIYPEKGLGKEFWDKVYAQVNAQASSAPIAMDAFNKVWITADRADVHEGKDTVFITHTHLKVMLEEDYLSTKKNAGITPLRKPGNEITQTLKQIVLPAIEKEINEGKNFAALRQMYHSMILASWYKMRLKNALLSQVYGNRSKVGRTIQPQDAGGNEAIFKRYIQAYKKGVFNFIRDEVDAKTYQNVPRRYFSGGLNIDAAAAIRRVNASEEDLRLKGDAAMVSVSMRLGRSRSFSSRGVPVKPVISKIFLVAPEFDKRNKQLKIKGQKPEIVENLKTLDARIQELLSRSGLLVVIQSGHPIITTEQVQETESYKSQPFVFVIMTHNGAQAYWHDPVDHGGIKWFWGRNALDKVLEYYVGSKKDPAMTADPLGGIDLNAGSIHISKSGIGVPVKVDPAMIERIHSQGFDGVDFSIQHIVPISNIQAILGAS